MYNLRKRSGAGRSWLAKGTKRTPFLLSTLVLVTAFLGFGAKLTRAEEDEKEGAPLKVASAGIVSSAQSIAPAATAVVNMADLAAWEKAHPSDETVPVIPKVAEEYPEPQEPYFPRSLEKAQPFPQISVAGPGPTTSFIGLDDIAMADTTFIIIPPDVGGGVGPNRVMCSFNNNYRVQDKTTGATIITVGTKTFWQAVVAPAERFSLTDPRTTYDPYNNCWITVMQTTTLAGGKVLVGVSQTSDPAGLWRLYNFNLAATLDFPNIGFSKNWIAVAINGYNAGGTAFVQGYTLVVNYPQARAGAGSGTLFTQAAGTHFCSGPCVTYSATEDTMFVVTHLSSAGATYQVDKITGTSAAPVYTVGGTLTRTGGGWVQPSGNLLPQSAPNSGTSVCGATPCKIETADAQVRSAPTFRGGFIYYTQTVGLPSGGLTHTGAQWTRLNATTGVFSQGGRIEDPTATATNGGKWYAYPHIAVNSAGDFIVGYTQFSSAQHPTTGYSVHLQADGVGVLRDPFLYHTGEDYYHKTFSTATGRNRWGDFSTAQVDPSDDRSLWTLQEYAKTRPGTDDGNTGSNSSKWSSWWAGVSTQFTITATAGANGSISPSGAVLVAAGANQTFTITPNACYHILDVLVDGSSVGPVSSFTFTNVLANHTISASFAVDTFTIVASAGSGGGISPSGNVSVNCGANQTFSISADPCYSIADVVVDGSSQGAISSYTFTNVQTNHTISASFSLNTFTITASAGAGGSISPSGSVSVSCGANQTFSIAANPCYSIADVVVDGSSQGAISSYTFSNVQANHTISASFTLITYTIVASANAGGTISPSGNVSVNCGDDQTFTITPGSCANIADVVVDGSSVGAVASYTFTNVHANHTITATFSQQTFTIVASAGAGGSISPSGNVSVNCGESRTFTIAADSCHAIADVVVDGSSQGAISSYTFTNVQANHTISASFTLTTYTITASAGAGGSISPSGSVSAACGSNSSFTITADEGYCIADVVVDGGSQGVISNYTFTNVHVNHTIHATFRDCQCPSVTVIAPNGGENLEVGNTVDLKWSATDNVGVTCVDLLLSRTGPGGPYTAIALCTSNSGLYTWTITGPPTTQAFLKVVAHDAAENACEDRSDDQWQIHDRPVPVELAEFHANPSEDGIELHWQLTHVELLVNTSVARGDNAAGPFETLTRATIRNEGREFTVLDRTAEAGRTYWYRLTGVTRDGERIEFRPLSTTALSVSAFALPVVEPNPVQGTSARIRFAVPRESHVRVSVIDVHGRRIATLADGEYRMGRYEVNWMPQGGQVAAGIYFVRLEARGQSLTRRFVVLH